MIRDTSRLKQAFVDGMIQKAEREIQHVSVSPPIGDDHGYQLLNRVRLHKKKMPMSKRVTIVLIAALLIVLTGCAIVYRNEIAGFFVDLFDGRVSISAPQTDDRPRELAVKMPSYIPEGYELVYDEKYISLAERKWENGEGETIRLIQTIPGQTHFGFDTDYGGYRFLQIGDEEVYYHQWDTPKHVYIWSSDYDYKLTVSSPLSEEELQKIIESIP